MIFAAIDFETADRAPDSACAVAVVRVEGSAIVDRARHLVRPPRERFEFTHVHGIGWDDVRDAAPFTDVWPSVEPLLDGVEFLAAHNAAFDGSVLRACCARAGLTPPPHPFECTVDLARRVWSIYPTKLPNVCRRLRIPLRHHEAASDAEACARIVLAAIERGWSRAPA